MGVTAARHFPAPSVPTTPESLMVPEVPTTRQAVLTSADAVRAALVELSDESKAAQVARYLRAVPGGYGEGDRFHGVPSRRFAPLRSAPFLTTTNWSIWWPASGTRSGWPRCASPSLRPSESAVCWARDGRSELPIRRLSRRRWPGARSWGGVSGLGRPGPGQQLGPGGHLG